MSRHRPFDPEEPLPQETRSTPFARSHAYSQSHNSSLVAHTPITKTFRNPSSDFWPRRRAHVLLFRRKHSDLSEPLAKGVGASDGLFYHASFVAYSFQSGVVHPNGHANARVRSMYLVGHDNHDQLQLRGGEPRSGPYASSRLHLPRECSSYHNSPAEHVGINRQLQHLQRVS